LSDQGKRQAENAGRLLKGNGFAFDAGFTSVLKRSVNPGFKSDGFAVDPGTEILVA